MEAPTAELAAFAAEMAVKRVPTGMSRFPTGTGHYVFEARFADGPPIVLRMGRAEQREEMARGFALARRVAALGVPLPAHIADGLDQPLPWTAMERLPGTDLGAVIRTLSPSALETIAERVAAAQSAVTRFETAGRYGFAARAEDAPHQRWSDVVEASLARSARRIESAGLFPMEPLDTVARLIERHRHALDAIPATPFLHDTTTKNVIVTETGRFSGIVDVDDLCFGDPRFAPALTLAALASRDWPTDYVRAWMARAGFADDDLFALYFALFLLDLMGEHGQRFNGNETASNPAARETLIRALAEALQ